MRKRNIKLILALLALIGSFFCFYRGTIAGLCNLWLSDGDYSYALLMPIITAYILWEKKGKLAQTPIRTNWLGLVCIVLLLVISIYGILGSSPSAVRPAIPLMILAIVLFCLGTSMFRVLFFPLGILIFMIPLPTTVQAAITSPLKLAASKLGVLMMRMFGITVFIEGNVIDIGVTQLQMADACSGLRYILPLFALGVLFAYFFEKVRWKQVVLVLATIPIAILANGLRVGITGILAVYYGTDVVEGFFHGFSGWLVFLIAFALLYLFQLCLKLIPMHTEPQVRNNTTSDHDLPQPDRTIRPIPVAICVVLLLLSTAATSFTASMPKLYLKNGFETFPLTFSKWQGKFEPLSSEIVVLSGAEVALQVTYTNPVGRIVSLYIGYRGTPFNENENFFHSPDICLPSSGWKIESKKISTVRNIPSMGDIAVKELVVSNMGHKQVVYYWFQTKARTSHNVNINRFHLSLHALAHDNTHDLFIRPITPIYSDENLEDAKLRMDSFVKDALPVLAEYIHANQSEKQ